MCYGSMKALWMFIELILILVLGLFLNSSLPRMLAEMGAMQFNVSYMAGASTIQMWYPSISAQVTALLTGSSGLVLVVALGRPLGSTTEGS